MPETAVNEDGFTLRWKNKVRAARQFANMKAVPPPEPPHELTNDNFGRSVLAANGPHDFATFAAGEDVCHTPLRSKPYERDGGI
jgi:hypothetical protein